MPPWHDLRPGMSRGQEPPHPTLSPAGGEDKGEGGEESEGG